MDGDIHSLMLLFASVEEGEDAQQQLAGALLDNQTAPLMDLVQEYFTSSDKLAFLNQVKQIL